MSALQHTLLKYGSQFEMFLSEMTLTPWLKLFFLLPSPEDQTLDMKKTSFKKLSKFLQMLQGQGLLKVKEEKKGIDFIVSVDKDHPE